MGCKGNAFAAKGNTLADKLYGVLGTDVSGLEKLNGIWN
jgi:hypothetical protein